MSNSKDNFENSQSIILENIKNQKHRLTISNNSKYIQFRIENLISAEMNNYILLTTLEELQKINRFFLLFKNEQEANKILIKSAKEKNLQIFQENDKCIIKIINQISNEEFSIDVPKSDNENFIHLFNDMKIKIEKLEQENILLKQKINDFEKRLIQLEKNSINNKNNNIIQKNLINNRIFKSNIINEHQEKLIVNWIENKFESANLLFDTSFDGDTTNAFKNKCKGKSPTLVIVKTDTGIIFGGYATSKWSGNICPIEDYNSFIFSFNPDKKYKLKDYKNALYGYVDNKILFQFGTCSFRIANKCMNTNDNYISTNAKSYYEEGFFNIIKGDSNADKHFTVCKLEIFQINF